MTYQEKVAELDVLHQEALFQLAAAERARDLSRSRYGRSYGTTEACHKWAAEVRRIETEMQAVDYEWDARCAALEAF